MGCACNLTKPEQNVNLEQSPVNNAEQTKSLNSAVAAPIKV